MENVPRIQDVHAMPDMRLLVHFRNGEQRAYNCRPLLSRPHFGMLSDPAFFKAVRVDPGGYGISWSDDIDISEYELWTNGESIANQAMQPTGNAGG
jgi:hypothetical protein